MSLTDWRWNIVSLDHSNSSKARVIPNEYIKGLKNQNNYSWISKRQENEDSKITLLLIIVSANFDSKMGKKKRGQSICVLDKQAHKPKNSQDKLIDWLYDCHKWKKNDKHPLSIK